MKVINVKEDGTVEIVSKHIINVKSLANLTHNHTKRD